MSQSTLFMQIEGITGLVSDKDYLNWISVGYINQGMSTSVKMDNATGQLNTDGIQFSEITFSKEMDKTSTQLAQMVSLGTCVKTISIAHAVKTAGKNHEVAVWKFSDCILNRYNMGVMNGGGVPSENLSFVFNSFTFETNTIEPNQTSSKQGPMGWNLGENTKL